MIIDRHDAPNHLKSNSKGVAFPPGCRNTPNAAEISKTLTFYTFSLKSQTRIQPDESENDFRAFDTAEIGQTDGMNEIAVGV